MSKELDVQDINKLQAAIASRINALAVEEL